MMGIGAIVIFLLNLIIYTPTLKNDFVNWDDPACIYENVHIRSLDLKSLYWMVTSFHEGNWHPLTWLTHALVYYFFGLNPAMHHLINIIVHACNTLLIYFLVLMILVRVAPRPHILCDKEENTISSRLIIAGGVTALLFGLHPLNVESVAWVTERKGLLSTFFVLLSLLSYLTYTSTVYKKRCLLWFCITLMLFIFALMSKPIAVTLPVTLLLLDIYPLKRIRVYPSKSDKKLSVFLEKIPFFTLSIASSIITIMAQQAGGALRSIEQLDLSSRVLNSLRSLVFYLEKMIVPIKLVPFYPLPTRIHWLDLEYLFPALLVLIISVGCLWIAKRGGYLFFIAWLYYVITLFPTLNIIQIGEHAAADRFIYLPSLSVFLLVGVGVSWIWAQASLIKFTKLVRGLLLVCVGIVMLLFGYLTTQQIVVWQNSQTLWSYVIKSFPERVPLAHNNLGLAYYEKGRLHEAIKEYRKALVLNPHHPLAHYNLGFAYGEKGRLDEAISEYKKALTINPNLAEAHTNLGLVYAKKGRLEEALSEYKKALTINPNLVEAHYNLGLVYYKEGRLDDAISEYKHALVIRPRFAEAHFILGVAYIKKGRLDQAIFHFKNALANKSNYAEAHHNLAAAYYFKGDHTLAKFHCEKVKELGYKVSPELLKALKLSH